MIAHDNDNGRLLGFLEEGIYDGKEFSIDKDHLRAIALLVFLPAALKFTCIVDTIRARWIRRISIFIKNKRWMWHQYMKICYFRTWNEGRNFLNFIELIVHSQTMCSVIGDGKSEVKNIRNRLKW